MAGTRDPDGPIVTSPLTSPRVCVILATYNGAGHLADQLRSLAGQSLRPTTLVLRDDGSTDDTLDIVARWAADEGIALQPLPAPVRLGPARSFLTAVQAAPAADAYFFCDQDDVWLPSKIERAVGMLGPSDDPTPRLVATRLQVVDTDLRPLRLSEPPRHLGFDSAVAESLLTGCTMAFNPALREKLARQVPEHAVMHDWWCYLLASAFGRVHYDAEPSLLYRQHGANTLGAGPQGWALWRERLTRFARGDRRTTVRSRQLEEFRTLFGAELDVGPRELLDGLLDARPGPVHRIRRAWSARIQRQSRVDTWTTRLALLMNRF